MKAYFYIIMNYLELLMEIRINSQAKQFFLKFYSYFSSFQVVKPYSYIVWP